MTRSCVGILLAVALVAGAATNARAQGLTGQITGTITDAGGGVMPGVTVVATNAGTNQRRETVTGPEGTEVAASPGPRLDVWELASE